MRDRPIDTTTDMSHLPTDRLENFIDGLPGPDPDPMERDHLTACSSCQQALQQLEHVHGLLAGLPQFAPPPGFREAVMERVDLPTSSPRPAPAAPEWSMPLWAALASVVLTVPTAGGLYWGLHQLGWLEPVAAQAGKRLTQWGWGALMEGARWLWETGLPQMLAQLATQLSSWEVAGLSAALFMVAGGSLLVVYRLLALPPPGRQLQMLRG